MVFVKTLIDNILHTEYRSYYRLCLVWGRKGVCVRCPHVKKGLILSSQQNYNNAPLQPMLSFILLILLIHNYIVNKCLTTSLDLMRFLQVMPVHCCSVRLAKNVHEYATANALQTNKQTLKWRRDLMACIIQVLRGTKIAKQISCITKL